MMLIEFHLNACRLRRFEWRLIFHTQKTMKKREGSVLRAQYEHQMLGAPGPLFGFVWITGRV